SEETPELVKALRGCGITAKTAAELVGAHPASRIRTKLEVFDWLLRNGDKRVGKNPAGYLVASIRADYQAPGDFTSADTKAKADEAERRDGEAKRRAAQRAREEEERAKAR